MIGSILVLVLAGDRKRTKWEALITERASAPGLGRHSFGTQLLFWIFSKKSTCQPSGFVLPSHKTVTIFWCGNRLMMVQFAWLMVATLATHPVCYCFPA